MNEEFNNKNNTNEIKDINIEQTNESAEDNNMNINKNNKTKKVLLAFISFILIFLIALTIYFVIDKKDNNTNGGKDNNIVNNNKEEDNNVNNESEVVEGPVTHKLVKVLDNEMPVEKEADNLKEFFQTGYYYDKNYVFYDKNGKNVTKEIFGVDEIGNIYVLDSDVAIVSTKDYKEGLYDENLNEIIEIGNYVIQTTENKKYFLVGNYGERAYCLENSGVYSIDGKMIIPREYEDLELINIENRVLFYAMKNGKYGVIDDKNNVIIPFEYNPDYSIKSYISRGKVFENDGKFYFLMYKDRQVALIDNSNNIIIDFKDNLSYYRYANAVIESDYENKRVNVYSLNGELKKVIDLNKSKLEYEKAYYYKLDDLDFIFYDDKYLYLLNNNFEFEKYVRPYKFRPDAGGDAITYYEYFSTKDIYLVGEEQGEKVKIYNTSNNVLKYKQEFYLVNNQVSKDIESFVLCKNKLEDNGYSNCGIVDYTGKIITDFNYTVANNYYAGVSNLLSKNEKIEFKYNNADAKYYIEKKVITDTCYINNKYYELENNVLFIDVKNSKREIYNSNCTKILDSTSNNFDYVKSINDKLIMTEKYRAGKDNNSLYKIYNASTGKLINIENKDNAVIIKNTIGQTINNEPTVVTNKGIYKIVEYNE